MKKNLLIGFILIAIPMMFLARVSTKPKWTDKKIEVKELLKIGEESFEDEYYSFGNIMDVAVSPGGSIIVLDSRTTRILKYSSDGTFQHYIGGRRGEGPGEFVRPWNIAVDGQENVYVTDHGNNRLSVFNSRGEFQASFNHKPLPISIAVDQEQNIYLGYYLFKSSGPYISKYNIQGELLGSFCQSSDPKTASLVSLTGNSGTLARLTDGNIVYSFFYPYDNRVFSPDGELLGQFSREHKLYRPPEEDKRNNVYIAYSGCFAVKALPEGKSLNLIMIKEGKDKKPRCCFDLFDREGNWLITFPADVFSTSLFKTFAADWEGNVFIPFHDPYPHVKKFSLKFQ